MATVLIHTLIFKPDGVSTAYLYADLAEELKKNGHKVIVLTTTPHFNIVEDQLSGQPLKKRAAGIYYKSIFDQTIPVYHIPIKKSKSSIIRIVSFIKFHFLSFFMGCFIGKIDVILSPSPPLTIGIISWLIAIFKNAKTIYNVQEIYPDFIINQGIVKNKMIISLLRYIESTVYNRSDAVVTIDDRFSQIIRGRIKDKKKLLVIPNFVDTELYVPLPRLNSFSKEYNLQDKFVIGYAGNIGYAQDWEPILYAAKKLAGKPILFLIIGDGVKKNWLKQMIEKDSLSNILLLPYMPRDKMPLINASCDVHTIVMAGSSSNEGFPSKIYTIMSSGRSSIVVTDTGSPLAQLMRRAAYGKIVPCGHNEAYIEAIMKLYSNRAMLIEEGQNGREFILANFSKEIICEKYNDLINQLVYN